MQLSFAFETTAYIQSSKMFYFSLLSETVTGWQCDFTSEEDN